MSRKKKKQSKPAKTTNNTLRIIGGQWRSRKLVFNDAPNLRPTPERIRETLFNWLQGRIHGTRCLDLFAGSGALGLEALSRGASEVVFVESIAHVTRQLESNLALLKANARVIHGNAQSYLEATTQPFDIIFLDPPFRQGLLTPILEIISDRHLLTHNGLIYLEQEAEETINWQEKFNLETLKETKAGQVKSYLLAYPDQCQHTQ
jgi:16S rRNA (guanine966-N2)-methyltransferase